MSEAIERLAAVMRLWHVPLDPADPDGATHEGLARTTLRALGLVAVDPALVERVREAERGTNGIRHRADYADACETLAAAVLAQLGGGR